VESLVLAQAAATDCVCEISALARRGAMIAFSTFVEPQTGQFTSERFTCLS
jgi:hypothetical protein